MTITDQQRKFIWIAASILAAAYFAPSIITTVWQVTDAQQARRSSPFPPTPPRWAIPNAAPAPQQAAVTPVTPYAAAAATPASPDEETAASAPATLTGKWEGQANTDTGICHLKLEVINPTDMPGIKGYGSMTCMALGPLVATQPKGDIKTAFNIVRRTTPTALLLSGKLRRDGAIRFHVDNIIGPPPSDKACTMALIKVAPFASGVVAQWEDGCKGGQAMLQRVRP